MSFDGFDKEELLASLVEALSAQVEGMTRRARAVAASATHDEARPENDKDTRAIEESYLARGQARRVAEAEAALQMMRGLRCQEFDEDRPVAATAVVAIEDEAGQTKVLFLAPAAGGTTLESQGFTVQVVTPASPLGRGLLGKSIDSDFEVVTKGKSRSWTIVDVC